MKTMPSLTGLLESRAEERPDDLAYVFLRDGEPAASLTYGALHRRARLISSALRRRRPDGPALLLYRSGLEFVAAFFGCLHAGVTAVPLMPPRRNRPNLRIAAVLGDCRPSLGLTTTEILSDAGPQFAQQLEMSALCWLVTDAAEDDAVGEEGSPPAEGDGLAYLQYTSGSTSSPKGVMVSHANLQHTLDDLDRGGRHGRDSVMVTWLPLFHDMGLVYGMLQPFWGGFPCYMMDPAAFLQRPARWLEAISVYRGTHSAAPNFAYSLCTRNVTGAEKAALDLRSWIATINAAEPVREDTLNAFAAAFGPCGFDPRAFCPGYGLAESTLKVTAVRRGEGRRILSLAGEELSRGRVRVVPDGADGAWTLVGCGRSEVGTRIVIVDPETRTECADDRVGEIWVAGGSVGLGYWGRTRETEEIFAARLADTGEGPFLRTGDLGFLRDGELFITGRLKDMIILRGLNHYPQDIEATVERSHPALRPGCGAAFSVGGGDDGAERLVVVQELERSRLRSADTDEVVRAIREAVARDHDLTTHAVMLLRPASIPKTSSGKIQRQACRAGFLEASLQVVAAWLEGGFPGRVAPGVGGSDVVSVGSSPPERRSAEAIEVWLTDVLAEWLKVPATAIDPREPFVRFGLDSATAVRISGALQERLGRRLSPAVMYDFPSVRSLAAHLAGEPRPGSEAAGNAPTLGPAVAKPIAVVGMGCRLPGAKNPAEFWRLLRDGVEAVSEPSASRPASVRRDTGEALPCRGGFLEDVDQFDADFFGISTREAEVMDPQHRLLLEVAWEALEDADETRVASRRVGVFIGISTTDYAHLQAGHPASSDRFAGVGNAMSIAANRLSYFLDLSGPSWAVDTACSSSLVAVHQACQSLLLGECELALVGGVNLLLSPTLSVAFARAGMLSADGRCKTFDAGADGYVRGEGCGVVVLKRLSDAVRDGDRVRALIRGTAVNQDGRSNGLTAPNGPAQVDVVRRALAAAGIPPARVSYVEAHGTGTVLGDPIEVNALKEALLPGRSPDQCCWLGSVKTNIGHLEAAAGVAGLIKVVLALENRELPPSLHLRRLNPHIDLGGTPLAVCTERRDWPVTDSPRVAGVSSFGFGGTNAHVVLEEAPAAALSAGSGAERPWHLLVLSARSRKALSALAAAYDARLGAIPDDHLPDVCFTSNVGRRHFDHRLAIEAESLPECRERLRAFASEEHADVASGRSGAERPKIAFLFTGQDELYPDMGRGLYDHHPGFRKVLDDCDNILRPVLDRPLLQVLFGGKDGLGHSPLDETAYAQPALCALEYALAELWRSWGIVPDAVLGHGVGEYAAACAAGVFGLEDGLRLVVERARLMQGMPPGEMWSVGVGRSQAADAIRSLEHGVSIAAIEGPEVTTLSGEREAVRSAVARLRASGASARRLRVERGFHSPQVDRIRGPFEAAAAGVAQARPGLTLIANVTGEPYGGDAVGPEYWGRQLREPVQFQAGVESLRRLGCRVFVEVGPASTLLSLARRIVGESGTAWLPSLSPGMPDWQAMLRGVGELYVRGATVDWAGFDHGYRRRRVPLPTYPFERRRYWFTSGDGEPPAVRPGGGRAPETVMALIERGDAEGLAHRVARARDLPPDQFEVVSACMRTLVDRHRQESADGLSGDWYYRPHWDDRPRRGRARPAAGGVGRWLILADRSGLGRSLARLLEAEGGQCDVLPCGDLRRDGGDATYRLDERCLAEMESLCREAASPGAARLRGVLHLGGLDEPSSPALSLDALAESQARGCGVALRLVQALARQDWTDAPKLWLVTRAAAAVGPAPAEVDVGQAPLWGMGRVIRLEHPDLWGGLIDLARDAEPEGRAEALLAELFDSEGEDQIAFRGGRRFVLRLRRVEGEAPPPDARRTAENFRLDDGKTYLITGGLGGLGLTIAGWMVERGARHLVLAGRSGGSSRARRRVQELEDARARVVVAQADVSLEGDVERLLGEIRGGMPPLGGVVHAAAVLDDGILLRQDDRRLAAVMAPKALGAWNLHQATRDLPLDFFLLFSSAASLLGWYGQGTYAAANAFLDALAHRRRAQGLPAVSVNWGPWSEIGLASRLNDARKSRMGHKGVGSLQPAQGLEAIERVLTRPEAQIAVLPIDWSTFPPESEHERPWRLLDDLAVRTQRGPAPAVPEVRVLGRRLQEAAAEDRLGLLVAHIQGEVVAILGLPPERSPEPRRGFFDMGMDSLMTLELKARLEAALGRRLPATLAFESPTIESLAAHLLDMLAPAGHEPAAPPDDPPAVARPAVARDGPLDEVLRRAEIARDGSLDEVLRLTEKELELLIDQEFHGATS